uniref:Phosducin like n=1 Tax=Apteryx owenii TaxID=8824 RepID=A0A8B9P4A6_APTOW
MTTLDDKLLGEKLQYYYSSSEGEDEDSEKEDKDGESTLPESVGEVELSSDGSAINTGPKGVINDWRRFKQLETEQRQEQRREMERLIKKLSMTCRSHLDEEADKQKQKELQEKINGKMTLQEYNMIHNDEDDEEFLQRYRKQRMEEMRQQLYSGQQFKQIPPNPLQATEEPVTWRHMELMKTARSPSPAGRWVTGGWRCRVGIVLPFSTRKLMTLEGEMQVKCSDLAKFLLPWGEDAPTTSASSQLPAHTALCRRTATQVPAPSSPTFPEAGVPPGRSRGTGLLPCSRSCSSTRLGAAGNHNRLLGYRRRLFYLTPTKRLARKKDLCTDRFYVIEIHNVGFKHCVFSVCSIKIQIGGVGRLEGGQR